MMGCLQLEQHAEPFFVNRDHVSSIQNGFYLPRRKEKKHWKSTDRSYTSIIIRPPRLHVPSLLEGTVVAVSSHFLAIKFEGYFSFNTMCGVAALRDN